MSHRPRTARQDSAIWCTAVLLVAVFALSVEPAIGQVTTKLTPAAGLDPGPTIGAGFLQMGHDGERPLELVLVAHRIEDDRILFTHQSPPVRVAVNRPVRLNEEHMPTERFYSGKVNGEVMAIRTPVPLESAERWDTWWTRVGSRLIGETEKNLARELPRSSVRDAAMQRNAVLFIAVPADVRRWTGAMASPVVVFLGR